MSEGDVIRVMSNGTNKKMWKTRFHIKRLFLVMSVRSKLKQLVFYVVFCRSVFVFSPYLFWPLYCPTFSPYLFWPLYCPTFSPYLFWPLYCPTFSPHFFWPLYCLSFRPIYFDHCIVCPSIYGFCLSLWYLQTFHVILIIQVKDIRWSRTKRRSFEELIKIRLSIYPMLL
jgi:hypothetical protein